MGVRKKEKKKKKVVKPSQEIYFPMLPFQEYIRHILAYIDIYSNILIIKTTNMDEDLLYIGSTVFMSQM